MKNYLIAFTALAAAVILFAQGPGSATTPADSQVTPPSAAQQSLPWAFALAPGRGAAGRGAGGSSGATTGGRGPADDGTLRHIPGSPVGFTLTQIRDMYNVVDWFPGSHPPYPDIDIHGRRPGVGGCGYCHLPTGVGRPENAPIAGLPADYIIQQLADFKTVARKGSEPRLNGPTQMTNLAKNATDDEIRTAAEYFANASFKDWIRTVETDTVPVTRVAGGMLAPVDPPATEPIGTRIIEVPVSFDRTEIRDTSSGFIAYVPKGSIEKGRVLATTGGGGKTVPCVFCHGNDLKGLGWVPPLAGRSPSYLVRQIFDFEQGNRAGRNAFLMKGAVEKLTVEDIVNVIAYAVSRQP